MNKADARLLADINRLAPQLAARAGEFEAARRIPPDIVDILRSLGLFRLFVPHSHGGLELDLVSGLEAIAALARIDGSLGWAAMMAASPPLATPLLSRTTYDLIYRNGPDVAFSGTVIPAGKAERSGGGWRVTGRWPFLSGCSYADWVFCVCVMTENGKPLPGPDGTDNPPMLRGFVVPARDWDIEDTWYVAGLGATGSHHGVLKDVFVPDAYVVDIVDGVPWHDGAIYQSVFELLPVLHAAVHVGIAEGALDDLVAMARGGRQQFHAAVPMQESETFQYELGRVAADVRAARAAFDALAASDWQHTVARTLKSDSHYIEATQMAVWIATTACRVADTCFGLGGGAAVYNRSPLQRRLRDAHVAAQHVRVQQRHWSQAGKLLLGTLPGGH